MHPFTGLATREDGAIKICCRSQPISFIQKESLEEAWNNETMRRVRKQVLNNERPPECVACFNLEDQGVESLRQRHIKGQIPESRINLYPTALDNLTDKYSMPFEFPTMEIKLNNLCNLKCRMCNPMDSTSWNDWDKIEEFYIAEKNFLADKIIQLNLKKKPFLDSFVDSENWWVSFRKLIPYFRRVEFAGGEPLMDPTHYKILDYLSEYGQNIEIKYATNGTVLGINQNRDIFNYWPKFKSVAVNISVDGVGPVYEHIRSNGNWNQLVENIKIIQSFTNVSRVVGAVAVQGGNVLTLDDMVETFLNDLGIIFYSNMVNYPIVLCPQVLPNELKKEAINKLENCKKQIGSYRLVKEYPLLYDFTQQQIQGIINFLQAKDQSHLWPKFLEFNNRLDKSRNQSLLQVVPEFKNYV